MSDIQPDVEIVLQKWLLQATMLKATLEASAPFSEALSKTNTVLWRLCQEHGYDMNQLIEERQKELE